MEEISRGSAETREYIFTIIITFLIIIIILLIVIIIIIVMIIIIIMFIIIMVKAEEYLHVLANENYNFFMSLTQLWKWDLSSSW